MSPKSKTARIIEYSELSKDFDFRDDIECALERDYADNPGLYDLQVLRFLACMVLLAPDFTPAEILDQVRNFRDQTVKK